MAIEYDLACFHLQNGNGERHLIQQVVIVVDARKESNVDGAEDHTDVGAVRDEAAEDGSWEPAARHLNIQLMAFLEASIWIEMWSVNLHVVIFLFERQGQIDDQVFGTADAEVWMQNRNLWLL